MKSLTMSSDIETSHDVRLEAPLIAIYGMEDLELCGGDPVSQMARRSQLVQDEDASCICSHLMLPSLRRQYLHARMASYGFVCIFCHVWLNEVSHDVILTLRPLMMLGSRRSCSTSLA